LAYRLVENLRKHQEKDRADKIDHADRDIEAVRLLVHIRPHNTNANQVNRLNNYECNSLKDSVILSQSNEETLDEDIDQGWYDPEICSGLELNVEESPLIQRYRIRVEDVSRVLVHGNAPARKTDDFGGSPSQDGNHCEDRKDGQDNLSTRVTLGKLPEAENSHLRESDKDDAEHDAFQDSIPTVAKVLKLFALHTTYLREELADAFEE
jgi:hypothetical protein